MLKSLFPHLDWAGIQVVGFDMDGTLYDELEFISQVYEPIADLLACALNQEVSWVYERLIARWVEKGSSYNHIFSEVLQSGGCAPEDEAAVLADCLAVFRDFQPHLRLSARTTHLLDSASRQYSLFLVSDGNPRLQQAKFEALGLGKWFEPQNVGFTGRLPLRASKPDLAITAHLAALQDDVKPSQVVYLGDRGIDRDFASKAGFQFGNVTWFHAGV